jgi:hypothetical protein
MTYQQRCDVAFWLWWNSWEHSRVEWDELLN